MCFTAGNVQDRFLKHAACQVGHRVAAGKATLVDLRGKGVMQCPALECQHTYSRTVRSDKRQWLSAGHGVQDLPFIGQQTRAWARGALCIATVRARPMRAALPSTQHPTCTYPYTPAHLHVSVHSAAGDQHDVVEAVAVEVRHHQRLDGRRGELQLRQRAAVLRHNHCGG